MEIKEPILKYDVCDLLHSITDLMKWWECPQESKFGQLKSYGAVRATGAFKASFDYGRGLMYVTISTSPYCEKVGTPVMFETRVHIGNIDDGSWEAYSRHYTNAEECNQLTEKVYQAFVKSEGRDTVLPTEEELNEMLRPLGMWGSTQP